MADLRQAGFVAVMVVAALLPIRARAQSPPAVEEARPQEGPGPVEEELQRCQRELDCLQGAVLPLPGPPAAPPAGTSVLALAGEETVAPVAAQQKDGDALLRKQVELQQKQIQVLEKMVRLLAEQFKKEPPAGAAVEKLQSQAAVLEARGEQAARRDQELAGAVDDLREQFDADQRHGPDLPSPLKELFLPTRTNESPLAIYGTLSADFQEFQDRNSNFTSPVFSPHFYLLLNEQFLLEVNPEFRSAGVEIESAQLDWFLTDSLTLVVGRFYSPLGFFNERLHTTWVFKTPDRPLVFQQVFPSPLSLSGLQLRGAHYLGDWPVKLEYTGFVTNGLSLDVRAPDPRDFANLAQMRDPFDDVNNSKAVGGRLGLSFPTLGVIAGLSGLANGAYDRAGEHDLSSWGLDLSWHKGNWDVRFEYARTNQQAPAAPIRRQGFYAQVAYRPYDCGIDLLSKLEGVFRFDHVQFDGIDLAVTGLDFGTRERIPVDRNRYTFGLNYYPYPSLVVKVAYQINDELRFRELRDNGFIAQVAWGF
ncbi:MAG: hypothetical protein L0Z62_26245 [Gemmataceae bacterium]|nr:hypothetical protein [Gemmataceae bacterium]